MYFVYILLCADNTLYTGITSDLEKRLHAHNHTKSGAKYTRSRKPVTLVYQEECLSESEAKKREWAIKSLTRDGKLKLVDSYNNQRSK